jgi:hypothetical protein
MSTEHSNCPACSSTVEHPRVACAVQGCPRAEEIERGREQERKWLHRTMALEANVGTRALFGHRPRREPEPPPPGSGNGEAERRAAAERRLALRTYNQRAQVDRLLAALNHEERHP